MVHIKQSLVVRPSLSNGDLDLILILKRGDRCFKFDRVAIWKGITFRVREIKLCASLRLNQFPRSTRFSYGNCMTFGGSTRIYK
jgi:hypothetical protein